MNILIVGNILKDVYLRLDTRTEVFETDKHGTSWLDISFNASKHHFFNRFSSFAGATISLEVLTKLGLSASILNSDFTFGNTPNNTSSISSTPAEVYRYILTKDDEVSYLVPTALKPTPFTPPSSPVDYLYIDRSAFITESTATDILHYLQSHPSTKLILYTKNPNHPSAHILAPIASLVFYEKNRGKSELPYAPALSQNIPPEKLIFISDTALECHNITMPISIDRVNQLTHLSAHSITSATILGCFLLGKTVEDSLQMAKINIENSTLTSTLSLDELSKLTTHPYSNSDNLPLISASLVMHPKGILAADESGGSIAKKFAQLNISDTFTNRHTYRNIFFTTPHLADYINGVILFDETARDYADNGQSYIDFLTSNRIIPGIKVDQGLAPLTDLIPDHPHPEETYTKGLDTLSERLKEYHQMGLRFAKWRSAFTLTLDNDNNIITPSPPAITENSRILAIYAQKCQSAGIVPIVEPELVYDGNYSIEDCAKSTGQILDGLFKALKEHHVNLRACILKCNMILAGKQYHTQSTPEEVGKFTADTLKNHVPADLSGIVFLSGGQTPEQATNNLSAIHKNSPFPWPVTFSFARALQDPALFTWRGNNSNLEKARQAFLDRLKQNSQAIIQ